MPYERLPPSAILSPVGSRGHGLLLALITLGGDTILLPRVFHVVEGVLWLLVGLAAWMGNMAIAQVLAELQAIRVGVTEGPGAAQKRETEEEDEWR